VTFGEEVCCTSSVIDLRYEFSSFVTGHLLFTASSFPFSFHIFISFLIQLTETVIVIYFIPPVSNVKIHAQIIKYMYMMFSPDMNNETCMRNPYIMFVVGILYLLCNEKISNIFACYNNSLGLFSPSFLFCHRVFCGL
jgi:hypothetical protein